MTERKQWFIDRIEKRVYRNHVGCECLVCKSGYTEGVVIPDTLSADYLCEMEATGNREGEPLMYFDNIIQRNKFEAILEQNSITFNGSIEMCVEGLVAKVGIEDASAINLFKKIVKNYINIKNIQDAEL